jgi:hypothetical protein
MVLKIIIKTSFDMVGSYPSVFLSSDGPFVDLVGSRLFGDHLVLLSSSYCVLTMEEIHAL